MTRPTALKAIYMDHNATVPVLPEVREAVAHALMLGGNPSSVHGFGRAARQLIDLARAQVAALAGVPGSWVVFTSGGTEANNLALRFDGTVLVSSIEHDSVLRAAPRAQRIPVNSDGVVDLGALDALLARSPKPALVSLMLANNETGVIQPVAEAAAIAHRHGALLHCDAVQAAGKVAIDMPALGADLLTLSAHKIGGPMGVGALIVREGVVLQPLSLGGGQESWRRAGTENVAGIAGFGIAATAARNSLVRSKGLSGVRDEIERQVLAVAPEATIYGKDALRVANTSCIGMPGVKSETQVMAFDLAGIALSAGAACSSGKVTQSAVLSAMGAGEEAAGQAIRVSLGWTNRREDADRFVQAWGEIYARSRRVRDAA